MSLFLPLRRPSAAGCATSPADAPQFTLAVLTGARSLVAQGWLQGAWFVLEAPDGGRRAITTGSLTRRSYGRVVRACLVGAVVEAAHRHTPERGASGPAIDALWSALREGEAPEAVHPSPSPGVRQERVCVLARWNDQQDRTRDDVLRLLDTAIRAVSAEAATSAAGATSVGVATSAGAPSPQLTSA